MARDEEGAGRVARALATRFGEEFAVNPEWRGLATLADLAEHRSHRQFAATAIEPELLRTLFACALSAPSKSDLQQGDIVHVADRDRQKSIGALMPGMPWIATAPVLLVFCGNNRRQRQFAQWRGKPWPNDHLDPFFNAAVDAGLVLMNFIHAAEAVGLGCCAISVMRDHANEISGLIGLPDWVFPVAGMAVGWPAQAGRITPRLPLAVTVHTDRFDESRTRANVEAYDERRARLAPYAKQRRVSRFGEAPLYGWSEDKARQYSEPERENWGAFVKSRKFKLD